jgi:hypothetical protein
MDWFSRFKSEFFNVWCGAGFPAPDRFDAAYASQLARACYQSPPTLPRPAPAPLEPTLVDAVYGFGERYARHCGILLGVSGPALVRRADWCGRFNLGISLLDYLCDEHAGLERVLRLRSLAALAPRASVETSERGDATEVFLDQLAAGLLTSLDRVADARLGRGLRSSLRRMFAAEAAAAEGALTPVPGRRVVAALRLKSEEPFAVMAQWVAQGADREGWQAARALGRALGHCYWLFDDARDLWEDFDARRWNRFLLRAIARDPRLVSRCPDAVLDVHLLRVLDVGRFARRASVTAVRRVGNAVAGLGVPQGTRTRALGLVAASLARL